MPLQDAAKRTRIKRPTRGRVRRRTQCRINCPISGVRGCAVVTQGQSASVFEDFSGTGGAIFSGLNEPALPPQRRPGPLRPGRPGSAAKRDADRMTRRIGGRSGETTHTSLPGSATAGGLARQTTRWRRRAKRRISSTSVVEYRNHYQQENE
jgi:hypothetical protein